MSKVFSYFVDSPKIFTTNVSHSTVGLSDSENYAITIVETAIFMIMNTIEIVGLCRFIP